MTESNPYVPPRTGSNQVPVAESAARASAQRRGWNMYAAWIVLGTILVVVAHTLQVHSPFAYFHAEELIPSLQALAHLREHASAVAASAAFFGAISFVHHCGTGAAALRPPALAVWPYFAAMPAGYAVSAALGLVVACGLDAALGIGPRVFVAGFGGYFGASDLLVGLLSGVVESLVLGAVACLGLPRLHRAIPELWGKIGLVWFLSAFVRGMVALVSWVWAYAY